MNHLSSEMLQSDCVKAENDLNSFSIVCLLFLFLINWNIKLSAKSVGQGFLACSKRSDSGERCEVKKGMKSRGGLGREVRERL